MAAVLVLPPPKSRSRNPMASLPGARGPASPTLDEAHRRRLHHSPTTSTPTSTSTSTSTSPSVVVLRLVAGVVAFLVLIALESRGSIPRQAALAACTTARCSLPSRRVCLAPPKRAGVG